ncbi:rubrerythrin family protein [bacterium]|nr:MAG: rubrerythrin family protein [bacterium]
MRHPFLFCSVLIVMILCLSPSAYSNENPAPAHIELASSHSENASYQNALLQDLQTAYFAEVVESELYQAFAGKAEEEGYKGVASLFRALSKAEEIHSIKRATLIQQYGGSPEKPSEPIQVGTTIENLDWSIEAESYEENFMYPDYKTFADQASPADIAHESALSECYDYCVKAEIVHTELLQDARKNLKAYQDADTGFMVCPRCGNIMRSQGSDFCTKCAIPKKDFITIR